MISRWAGLIIDYIQMSNFLSHSDTSVRFENGVNIIYGKNGAGKSSIVDAIRFALFGEKRGDKIAELIRSNTGECSVTIGFRLNDRYYEVFRSLGLGKSGNITRRDSWIKLDGVMIAETSEGVTKEIQSGLRIPRDIFLNSVFVRQGEMDALISETQANREKLFSKIIGIDALSESAQKIKSIRDSLKLEEARLASVEERIGNNAEEMEKSENALRLARTSLDTETARERAAKEAAEVTDRLRNEALQKKAAYDALIARTGELHEKIGRLNRNIDANTSRISGLSYSKDEKEAIENNPLFANRSLVAKYFSVKSEFLALEVSLENVRSAVEDYSKEKDKLEKLRESHKRYQELDGQLAPMESKIREMQSSRAIKKSLDEEIAGEKAREDELKSILTLPQHAWLQGMDRGRIGNAVGEMEKKLRSIEGERNALKERIGSLNRHLAELRKNKETLGDRHKCPVCGSALDESHLREIHSSYQEQEDAFLANIGETGGRVAQLNSEYRKLEEDLQKLKSPEVEKFLVSVEEISRIRDSVSTKEKRVSEAAEKVLELEALEKRYEEQRKEKEKLQASENEFNSVVYAMGRIPIETLMEKLEKYQADEKDKKKVLEEMSQSIGFEPVEEDRERLDGLMASYEKIRAAESEHQKVLNELENDRRALEELKRELESKENERRAMGDVANELERSSRDYSTRQKELSEIRQSVAALSERVRAFNDSIEKLSRDKESLRLQEMRLERMKAASSKLEKIRNAFERNGIQALIRKDSSVAINNMTRNYLSSFNFEFDDVRIDENFDIKVINNGVEEPLDALSGGERISLAIAVRLAIARYLTGRVSTVIMDEPTNFLDEDRRNNLKDIIRYSLKDENMVQQMIMITHHSELTSAADSSFEVTKSNGVSSVAPG